MSNYILTKSLEDLPSTLILTDLSTFQEFAELDETNAAEVSAAGLTLLPAASNEKTETDIVLVADKDAQGALTLTWITVDAYKAIETNKRIAAGALQLRNKLLQDSDWTQIADVNLTNKADWATYRQALRDVPAQEGFPLNVTWPAKPE